ncbi:MAG: hypothetical protein AMXMBFR64_38900 [Myxococcales bacterium]
MTSRLALLLVLAACAPEASVPLGGGAQDVVTGIQVTPAPPRLARLSRVQVTNAVRDTLGPELVVPAGLEPDTPSGGLVAVGATVATLSKRGVEQSFDAALSLASQAVANVAVRARVRTCDPATDGCIASIVKAWGLRLWRRPLSDEEVATLATIGEQAQSALGGDGGVELVLATLLASPHFLYRVELGEPSPDGGPPRYTGYEMAARLALLLWNTVPDDALLEAAARGDLTDALPSVVEGMLKDPRTRQGVRAFFADWLGLAELDQLGKDPTVFEQFSADLGPAAREETLRLVERVIFDRRTDVRELFTTRETYVTPRLAAIYDVPAPDPDGFGLVELPSEGARAGILGHVSFLAPHAHPTSSSATKRGVALRQRILCQTMPSPPSELNTAIPEPSPDALTLRDRLEAHRLDPACASCHDMMDPPGYGFEVFDGLGRFRLLDNGAPIDPSGELDGVPFDGARTLVEAVAAHPDLMPCIARTAWRYAVNREETPGERAQLDAIATSFAAEGRFERLLFDIATSPAFRRVGEAP